MAKTKNQNYIVEQYVRYFGKTPTDAQIADYADLGKPKLILAQIRGEADDAKPSNITYDDYIDSIFQNLFGRLASGPEKTKYAKTYDKKGVLPINAIVKAAKPSDKAVYQTKKAVAFLIAEEGSTTKIDLDKITKYTYKEIYNPKTKKFVGTLAEVETIVDAMPDNVSGQTITLNNGVDMLEGTEKGDVFNSFDVTNPSTNTKLSTLDNFDTLDGKGGNDTLNIQTGFAIASPILNLTSIETVNVKTAQAITNLNGSAWDGTNTLNVTQATAATLTAAATTDVNVSGVTGTVTVDGGKNVVVNDSTTNEAITVGKTGATTTNAAGTITVTDTDNSGATNVITVNGGTDVTVTATSTATTGAINVGNTANGTATGDVKVTQNLDSANDAADITAANINVIGGKTVTVTTNATTTAKSETSSNSITVSAVNVTADDKTTDVTVKAIASITNVTRDAVDEVKGTTAVTFKDVAEGDIVTVNGLKFTAAKDLTAAEVAKAFANLTATDTQSEGGITTNGIYTGALTGTLKSGAANGATVVFTNTAVAGTAAPTMTITATDSSTAAKASALPTEAPTTGTAAVTYAKSTNDVTLNTVVIDDNTTKSIENITVKGATTVTLGGSAVGTSLDALKTLSLANVVGATALNTTATALNLTVNDVATATNTAVVVNLDVTAATITDLTLKSTGDESKLTLAAIAVKNLTVDAGAALTISSVSATNVLETVAVKGTASVNLGTIVDSINLKSFDASANTGGVTATINASTAASNAVLTTFVFSGGKDVVTVSGDVNKAINLGAGDDKITLTTAAALADINGTIDGGTGTDTIHMTAALAVVATAAGSTFDTQISNIEQLSLGSLGIASIVDLAKMDNISYVISANNAAFLLTLNNMANNGTLELADGLAGATNLVNMKDATGKADTFNVVTNVTTTDLNMGTVTVAGVETINITANDTVTAAINKASLILDADAAKTVNVEGNSDVALTLTAASKKVTMIDGSSMKGGLTATTAGLDSAATIKGGLGDDTLTANKDNDVLIGGAGNDTLIVASGNLVQLHGGAGRDTYQFGASSNQNAYATINGTKAELSGEIIKFTAGIGSFNDAKIVLGSTAVFQDYVNEAANGTVNNGVSYFTWAGDTYLVQDNDTSSATFENGTDAIVKITGTVDFTFNASTNVLEIA